MGKPEPSQERKAKRRATSTFCGTFPKSKGLAYELQLHSKENTSKDTLGFFSILAQLHLQS